MRNLYYLIIICLFSCKDGTLPKPEAYLRLEYPKATYKEFGNNLPFTFSKNNLATKVSNPKMRANGDFAIDLEYPSLKGTIYLTYKKVTSENLIALLKDAQTFTQKHAAKADEIAEQQHIDEERKVYGMFYEIGGNAASQSQFYVTDSVSNFVSGSLYFYAKPNYDSILPAAYYLRNDIKRIMETIKWK